MSSTGAISWPEFAEAVLSSSLATLRADRGGGGDGAADEPGEECSFFEPGVITSFVAVSGENVYVSSCASNGRWVGWSVFGCTYAYSNTPTHKHTHTHTHHTTECSEGGKSAKQAGIGSRSDALIGAAFVPGRDVIMAATVTGSIEVQDCLLRYIQILASERPFASSTCTNKRTRAHTHAHALSY